MIGPRWSRILAYYIIEVFFVVCISALRNIVHKENRQILNNNK